MAENERARATTGADFELEPDIGEQLRFQLVVDALPISEAARPALEAALDRADQVIAEEIKTKLAALDAVLGPLEPHPGVTGHEACVVLDVVADDAELARIGNLRHWFGTRVGYSDHTLRTDTALAAVCAGAAVLEKHCTLDEAGTVPDDRMALTVTQMALEMESRIRRAGYRHAWQWTALTALGVVATVVSLLIGVIWGATAGMLRNLYRFLSA